ncbi:WD40-repeat-containing domain protein [Globomyces pollinis-pini]|nr:WD40-repeat-containing domain protein [Globomyces pollinis-pini]
MLEKSQIIVHSSKSITYTAFDVKWIPSSPRFVVLGQQPKGEGIIQIFKLSDGSIKELAKIEKPAAFKCGTFGASSLTTRHFATGDFNGRISLWDLETLSKPLMSFKGHDQIINCIDGVGGQTMNSGPPEIVTGSRDGTVKIWDVRQGDTPVATLAPEEGAPVVDPWTVAFGNSYNNEDRMLSVGYENGDLKLFDLRSMKLQYETNLKNGVCSVEFDRKDIKMNKLVVVGLESKCHLFDLRTFHPKKGYSSMSQKSNSNNTTGWTVRHLPQNRDIFMISNGSGTLDLFKYFYPANRVQNDIEDEKLQVGVMGRLELIQTATVAEQPVGAFDWSPDKLGLCAFTAFDQTIKVGMVTRLSGL